MLQTAATTRSNHSNRFRRGESDQPRNARSRLGRLRPFFPIYMTPGATCPHGVRIHDGDVCMVKHCTSRHTQQDVDRTNPPPPVNPEDRALGKILEYQQAMEHLDPAKHHRLIAGLQVEIDRQRAIVDEYAGQPTVYRPDPRLKGGK